MKKVLAMVVCLGMMVFGMMGVANALPYSDTVDWNDFTYFGRTAKLIDDTNLGDPYPFVYTHNVTFDPPAASIDSASITLSHRGNVTFGGLEAWLLSTAGNVQLGLLDASGGRWVDQVFELSSSVYSAISGGSWSLGLRLTEDTGGWDTIYLDRSVLQGEYTAAAAAVPEPSIMILLGSALVGLGLFGRKLRKS